VWTRGDDRHSEWGGRPLTVEEIRPHYLNDYVLARARAQAALTGWVVRTNPFEGGSDHTPFLSAGKPGLLLWHFTDVFYHTDNDRLDKVSPRTLENVAPPHSPPPSASPPPMERRCARWWPSWNAPRSTACRPRRR
jgi:hypothetical protein